MRNTVHHLAQQINRWISPAKRTSIFAARIYLFNLMLGANILKGGIYLSDALIRYNGDGSLRALRLIGISVLLMALLKKYPKLSHWGIHFALIGTVLHIYYRIFNLQIGTDVIAQQCIYMVIISSFYGLNKFWGTIYTIAAAMAIIVANYVDFRINELHPLPTLSNDIYIGINFLVILISHLYFHGVLYGNLREMKALNKRLKASDKSRSTFLSTMSHELRTPLNSVIGIAGLLINENTDQGQKKELDMLKFSAEGLLALINDILDVNKFESGQWELESIPFNLHTLIHNITSSLSRQPNAKSVKVSAEVDARLLNTMVLGDPTRLGQIMNNLVGNAIKFSPSGEVRIIVELLRSTSSHHQLKIEVKDNGIGISPIALTHIFEPFRQAAASTNRKFGGTGLGLAIVKQLVEKFGGQINVKSALGKGTSFFFEIAFPIAPAAVIPEGSKDLPASAELLEKNLSKMRILLAEDNMMNIYFMQQLFKRWSLNLDIAENGMEVLEMLDKNAYDVILMDMHMPVMDGIETTQRIRLHPDSTKSGTYIIALTATISDNIQSEVKGYGMNDYLHKPFQLEDLKRLLINRQLHISTVSDIDL